MLFLLVRPLPFRAAVRLGEALGSFICRFAPFREDVALINLRAAFPEKTETEREAILRGTYRHFGAMFMEYLAVPRLSGQQILDMITEVMESV